MNVFARPTRQPLGGCPAVGQVARAVSVALGLGLAPPAVMAQVSFERGYNFRDNRVDAPLPFQAQWTGDGLSFGLRMLDAAGQPVTDGADLRARNSATGEVVRLQNFGDGDYGWRVPFTADRAQGEWVVTAQAGGISTTTVLPAFGTGPGTGLVPAAGELDVVGGATPRVSWSLPSDAASRNDGNVSSQRVRIEDDSRGGRVFEQRDLPLSQRALDVPDGTITENGVYRAEVLVDGDSPFNRSARYDAFRVTDAQDGGTPVNIDGIFVNRDVRGPNSVGWSTGDRLSFTVEVDHAAGTSIDYSSGDTLFGLRGAADQPESFSRTVDYDASRTGPWTATVINGEHVTSTAVAGLGEVPLMPSVRNVQLTPDGTTPTLTWELPGDLSNVDQLVVGLFDDVTDFRLRFADDGGFFQRLDPTATSFTFPEFDSAGDPLLREGAPYVARVMTIDREEGESVSRAISFLPFTPVTGQDRPVEIPRKDGADFVFDFDVTEAVPVLLDPFVATGYDYLAGEGDPLFTSVRLPDVGDGQFTLELLDALGEVFGEPVTVLADELFDFEGVTAGAGASGFRVTGIEADVGLDPGDVLAFVTEVTFGADGRFTGTQTPIVEFVEPEAVASGGSVITAGVLALALARLRRRRRCPVTNQHGRGLLSSRPLRGRACGSPGRGPFFAVSLGAIGG